MKLDIFCPRHFITLQAINSPFVIENPKEMSFRDLFIAMRICSTPSWEEAVKEPNFIELWKYRLIKAVPQKQMDAFMTFGKYMSESMSSPKVWKKDDENTQEINKTNIPETLSIVVCLMTKFGMSEKEAWNIPFARAMWYVTAFSNQEGGEISIISTEDEENEVSDLKKLEDFEKKLLVDLNLKGKAVVK